MSTASDVLLEILAVKHEEVAAARARISLSALKARITGLPDPRDLAGALERTPGALPRVIAEIKRASPSAGTIRKDADPVSIAREYEHAGASGISVLTDQRFFSGSLADLAAVRAETNLPVLRKDFIIDEYQLYEARSAGADAVLLIARVLGQTQLTSLLGTTRSLGMTALVETHDENEVACALESGATVIGINHRNLATLKVDLSLSARLRPLIPANRLCVAESGIRTAADVRALARVGIDAILVGESLMRTPAPGAALRELLSG